MTAARGTTTAAAAETTGPKSFSEPGAVSFETVKYARACRASATLFLRLLSRGRIRIRARRRRSRRIADESCASSPPKRARRPGTRGAPLHAPSPTAARRAGRKRNRAAARAGRAEQDRDRRRREQG